MQELNVLEVEQVSGGTILGTIGYYVGLAMGAGASMQHAIDGTGNEMMSAMQYGA